ncbi:hypothetical protein [Paenibacillus sp. UNC496MF]|uniref:hypothetical protein n=1 Tax=Paenibacillus sp. UNC496MF TaxID=1502753 RepID=UPI0015A6BF10|nr:hypothetical protein [Paenibacillus sp. UNC496MF]
MQRNFAAARHPRAGSPRGVVTAAAIAYSGEASGGAGGADKRAGDAATGRTKHE